MNKKNVKARVVHKLDTEDTSQEDVSRFPPEEIIDKLLFELYADEKKQNTILDEAKTIVEGVRRQEYGDITDSFNRIARMWGGYLGITITNQDVAHLMIMLKIARNYSAYKQDSMIDVCGYAYCADLIHQNEAKEKIVKS